MTFFLGLDLGQASDPTALAILERIEPPQGSIPRDEYAIVHATSGAGVKIVKPGRTVAPSEIPQPSFHGRHLERVRLGTSYPDVATHVLRLLEAPPLKGKTELVVDATGVGRPVVDMLVQRGLEPVAITITGGDQVTYDRGWRVPKRDLVGAVQVLLQTERLKFAQDIPAVPTLVQELLAFRVKIDPLTAHDSYGAWREGAHDDLVLAVAVAAWWGQRAVIPHRTLPGSRAWPVSAWHRGFGG
jgi:hypothetical protein